MLTQKYMDFVEKAAALLQSNLKLTKTPNLYNYDEVKNFFEKSGAKFKNIDKKNLLIDEDGKEYISIEYANKFFYDMWKFIACKITQELEKETDLCEQTANNEMINMCATLFSRAMIMPKEIFIRYIFENINVDGTYPIEVVSNYFNVHPFEITVRGRDLDMWGKNN